MSVSFIYPGVLWLLGLIPLIIALAWPARKTMSRARFFSSLVLRIVLMMAVVLALAGMQLRQQVDTLTVIFVLDVSDSLPKEEQARGQEIVRSAIQGMPPGDKAAVVVFGKDALVERLPSEERSFSALTSVPVTTRTNIADALQLALALFPDEGAKRIVLLSDGRENVGYAIEQAELAAAHGVEITFIPLRGPQGEAEVYFEALSAPTEVSQSMGFNLIAVIDSSLATVADLRIFIDGELNLSRAVNLVAGTNRFALPIESLTSGFHRFEAQILPEVDTRLQNNYASAFTVVHGPPRILILEGQAGESFNLAQALRSVGMEVDVLPAASMPTALAELAAYESIILANVPAAELPTGMMEMLRIYVGDLGRGLMMTGGERAFGAGGYLRTPIEEIMPVDMSVRTRQETPGMALVVAVDKSGSMGRCHCDNPDLNQTYTRREVGEAKVDIAKVAIMKAAGALDDQDYLGVVAFDQTPRWALEIQPLLDSFALEEAIGGITANGQTNLQAGIEAAYETLTSTQARVKHVILITDGWVRTGELTSLAQQMRAQGITLSVVAAGEGSADYLKALAELGGGRFYPAVDIMRVPEFFLKETITAVGQYIVEKPFYPLPAAPSTLMAGVDVAGLPLLLGYNGTTAKQTAQVVLTTPQGDPLLATWQYGLGRTVAWTSDFKGQWAKDWLTWQDYPAFIAGLVNWMLPLPEIEGLDIQITNEAGRVTLRATAEDQSGLPRNFLQMKATLIASDLSKKEVTLSQVAPGEYRANADLSQPGVYMVQINAREGEIMLGEKTLGYVVPYSPEYTGKGTDMALLSALARSTGGSELAELKGAFLHNLPVTERAHEFWDKLLLLAALLFPLDVAVRRLTLGRRDLRAGLAWLRQHMPQTSLTGGGEGSRERLLEGLFRARERVRDRSKRSLDTRRWLLDNQLQKGELGKRSVEPEEKLLASADTIARLKEAKRRVRRNDRPEN